MEQNIKYYVVKDKAIPEVLIKVVEAKRLLTADKMMTVKEATDKCGISRSSFSESVGLLKPSDGRTIFVNILQARLLPHNKVAALKPFCFTLLI